MNYTTIFVFSLSILLLIFSPIAWIYGNFTLLYLMIFIGGLGTGYMFRELDYLLDGKLK